MQLPDLGRTAQERQELLVAALVCMSAAIFATDLLTPYGFIIWILYLIPVLMTVWLPYRAAPFLTAALLIPAIVLPGILRNLQNPLFSGDLPNRAIFIAMLAIVSFLAWEIHTAYGNLGREITERARAHEKLEELAKTLEQKVQERTTELSQVNTALSHDIEERKKAEEALVTAHHKLSLLSGITRHDILNKIFALNTYLRFSRKAVPQGTQLDDCLDRMQRITRTIEKQITFTRDYENIGAQAPRWQQIDLLIRNAAEETTLTDRHIKSSVGSLEVYADPMFPKVFYNLIDNALQHGGKVTEIRFSCHTSGKDLIIVYEDNGVGIPADDKPNIFTRGFGKHTGLGLFLSREILSITKMAITENGEPGNGARFEITVPEGMYRF